MALRSCDINIGVLTRMGIPKRYWYSSIDKIGDGDFKGHVIKYIENIEDAVTKGFGMILNGVPGTGKTAIGCLVLKQARKLGFSGYFISSANLIKNTIEHEKFDDSCLVTDRCRDVDLLVIDDLVKEVANLEGKAAGDGSAAIIESLVKDRYADLKSTVITTNLVSSELSRLYGESMINMMIECAPIIHVNTVNIRSKNSAELLSFYKD